MLYSILPIITHTHIGDESKSIRSIYHMYGQVAVAMISSVQKTWTTPCHMSRSHKSRIGISKEANVGRRMMNILGTSLALSSMVRVEPSQGLESPAVYSGSTYSIQYPSTWEVSSKAGADVLFKGSGVNVGITILPVRISRVEEYGTVEQVAEKIVQTEKAKDGTLRADMINSRSVDIGNGITAYDYDYEIQSTRGTKRIVSRVCIRDKQLFVVNGTITCGKVETCDATQISNIVDETRGAVQSFAFATIKID
jgi:hypothetical protein